MAEPTTIASLPASVLATILISASPSPDLLLHLATVAQVQPEFRRVVLNSAAYGAGLDSVVHNPAGPAFSDSTRTRVLRDISRALMQLADRDGKLILFGRSIGDQGGHVLAAALWALPPPLALADLTLTGCGLGTASAEGISAALRCGFAGDGLRTISLTNNPNMRDPGIAALAAVLPPTLTTIAIANTGCGNAGIVALAAALPPALVSLVCSTNTDIAQPGWAALGEALGRSTALIRLNADDCSNMRCAGVASIAAGLQEAAVHMQELRLDGTGVGDDGIAALLPVVSNFEEYSTAVIAGFGLSLAGNSFGADAGQALA